MSQFNRLHLWIFPLSLNSLSLLQLHRERSLFSFGSSFGRVEGFFFTIFFGSSGTGSGSGSGFFSTFFGILKGFGSGFGSTFFSSFFLFSSAAFFSTGFGLTVTFPVLSSLPLLFSKTTLKSPMSSMVQEAMKRVA